MTQNLERAGTPAPAPPPSSPPPPAGPPDRRGVRVWMILLVLSTVAVFAYVLPPYLGLDPAKATVPLPPEFPTKYAMLVGHILFGSIAMVTMCLQVWPWLRREHPAIHRRSGRLYVFAGVLPSVVLSFYLLVTSFGGPGWVGRASLAALWFITTLVGYVRARQRRYQEHRRFMIYSFALTMEALSGRLLANGLMLAMGMTPGEIPTEQAAAMMTAAEASAWLGWVVNLMIAAWWLDGRGSRRKPGAKTKAGTGTVRGPAATAPSS
ncbi:hypothetical protein GCM10010387_49080 [Streptomyces inusitatus]|uniref:DUF2306 domain-containing protein n=1 Tax=Streptomyces inusitatus TaxID=68221 RepID=A0A918QJG3_9ACTN|nr:DUF2306 domain-containing protein [Streptomyces inusitatus]GGZ48869.1 hypothetical protein GCM10010387_49080 [Streptomyces inusitatus]